MGALAIGAVVVALGLFIVPGWGPLLTPVSGVMALPAAGRHPYAGLLALALNLVNILFFSPMLTQWAVRGWHSGNPAGALTLGGLILCQLLLAAGVGWRLHRRHRRAQGNP